MEAHRVEGWPPVYMTLTHACVCLHVQGGEEEVPTTFQNKVSCDLEHGRGRLEERRQSKGY